MGWQARLSKDQKPEFKRTCNKCGDTGVRRRIKDGVYRDPKTGFKHFNGDFDVKCVCIIRAEEAAKAAKNAAVVKLEDAPALEAGG